MAVVAYWKERLKDGSPLRTVVSPLDVRFSGRQEGITNWPYSVRQSALYDDYIDWFSSRSSPAVTEALKALNPGLQEPLSSRAFFDTLRPFVCPLGVAKQRYNVRNGDDISVFLRLCPLEDHVRVYEFLTGGPL